MQTIMSSSPNVKYQPLAQNEASEDEGFEENILYDSRLVQGPTSERRNVFELQRLGESRSTPGLNYAVRGKGKGWRLCVLVATLSVIILVTVAAILFPILNDKFNHGTVIDEPSSYLRKDWRRTFNNSWTESSVTLKDVDRDGLDDILISLADQDRIEAALNRPGSKTMKEYCSSIGENFPCGATFAAFRGFNGKEIWRSPTYSVGIHVNCGFIISSGFIISMKNKEVCIITGRHSTCQAIDIKTGKILWVVDPESPPWSDYFVPKWNTYRALFLPDIDDDGYMDILISHGGDKDKEPWEKDRSPGRLILLSGKTGLPIGRYLETPDGKEIYMPPIKYEVAIASNGRKLIYILFGSGGETIPGKLFAVSLPDLYRNVFARGKLLNNLYFDMIDYNWLVTKPKDENGVAVLYTSQTKGVMVPPVLVDVDDDGMTDLLISAFDGRITLLDGRTLVEKWVKEFPGMESYSVPAPGYYYDDMYVDFLIHMNEGVWDKYNASKTLILSGRDGSVLWSYEAGSYAYSSDLSLKPLTDYLRVFLMKLVGRNSSGANGQSDMCLNIDRRHLNEDSNGQENRLLDSMSPEEFQDMCVQVRNEIQTHHLSCSDDLDSLTQEIFLMDRFMSNTPLKVLEQKAVRYHYQLPHVPGKLHCHPLSLTQKDKIDMCAVLVPTSYTGAVGDVDGDRYLDYVHVTQMLGSRRSDRFDIKGPISRVILSKHSLKSVLDRKETVSLGAHVNVSQCESVRRHLETLELLPPEHQVWAQYMGNCGNCYYYWHPNNAPCSSLDF